MFEETKNTLAGAAIKKPALLRKSLVDIWWRHHGLDHM